MIVLALCPGAVYAAPGDLDATFGQTGVVTITAGNDHAAGNRFAEFGEAIMQPDGKTLVVGSINLGIEEPNINFLVARLRLDGSLDPTFGEGGIVQTDIGALTRSESSSDDGGAIALMADGRIVVAGETSIASATDIAVVRYLADGTVDRTFGEEGVVTTDVGLASDYGSASYDSVAAVAVMEDGRVVVGGSANTSSSNFAVVRYLADGTLDPDFGKGGAVTTDIRPFTGGDPNSIDFARAMALLDDGRILLAGLAQFRVRIGDTSYNYNDFALVRYQADGTLDATFDEDGVITTDVRTTTGGEFASADGATGVTILDDGRMIAVGYANVDNAQSSDFTVIRYLSNGELDPSWAEDGIAMTDIGAYVEQDPGSIDTAAAVALTPDGRVLVAGYANLNAAGEENFAIAQYLPDGTLDLAFGNDGVISTNVTAMITDHRNEQERAQSVALMADGRFVVGGNLVFGMDEMALVRYHGITESPPDPRIRTGLPQIHR